MIKQELENKIEEFREKMKESRLEYIDFGQEWDRGYSDGLEEAIKDLEEMIFYCNTYEK